MTFSQLVAYITVLAAIAAAGGAVSAYRARRAAERTLPSRSGDGAVCSAYQLPSASADSGLCAGCGMYDYKHREAAGA